MIISHFPFSIFNLNTAVVTNCHEDAYIDCTWSGGEGISFSDNHSLDEGASLSDEADYQVIEPIRKLVKTERYNGNGPIMNPSRLVWGTNAILKVSVNLAPGDTFSTTNGIF